MPRPALLVLIASASLFACSTEPPAETSLTPARPSIHLARHQAPESGSEGEVTFTSALSRPMLPSSATEQLLSELDESFEEPPLRGSELDVEERVRSGRVLYQQSCASCHQEAGQGVPDLFPPLQESDFLVEDEERAIRIVLNGLAGKVLVNGRIYDALMPSHHQLEDDEIASILTFVLRSWGNDGDGVTSEEVSEVRQRVRDEWREPPPERAR